MFRFSGVLLSISLIMEKNINFLCDYLVLLMKNLEFLWCISLPIFFREIMLAFRKKNAISYLEIFEVTLENIWSLEGYEGHKMWPLKRKGNRRKEGKSYKRRFFLWNDQKKRSGGGCLYIGSQISCWLFLGMVDLSPSADTCCPWYIGFNAPASLPSFYTTSPAHQLHCYH